MFAKAHRNPNTMKNILPGIYLIKYPQIFQEPSFSIEAVKSLFFARRVALFSSINEIANMICGRAISILNDSGKKLDISAPTIFVGQEMTLYDSSIVGEALVIPLKSNFGELFINVALTD